MKSLGTPNPVRVANRVHSWLATRTHVSPQTHETQGLPFRLARLPLLGKIGNLSDGGQSRSFACAPLGLGGPHYVYYVGPRLR